MHPPSVAALRADFDVLEDPRLGADRDRLLTVVDDAVALVVRNQTLVDGELLDAAPKLEVVARLGVGLDNIDQDACRKRDVEVAPATGANAIAVAEYVIGSMLTLVRNVFHASPRVIDGDWPRAALRGRELSGRTLGLIGYGLIAREVAARALAMGMDVVAHDPYLQPDDPAWGAVDSVDLDSLVAVSDAISAHVPLTPETHHLVDSDTVAAMREGAFVVNTARGGVVDEDAVIAGLTSGHLGGAALDVFEAEPLDRAGGLRFDGVPNLILTPHIAGITDESEARIGELTVATVRRHLKTL